MATSEQGLSASPLVGARVLVAEDDTLVALYLMTTLQTASYVVVGPVSSVAEGHPAERVAGWPAGCGKRSGTG